MSNNSNNNIKSITNDTLAIIIIILISIYNIYGNYLEKKTLISGNTKYSKKSKNIFIITLIISIIIYLYFINTIYKSIKEEKNQYFKRLKIIRLFGAILILVGISLLLYYRVKEKGDNEAPII